MSILRPGPHGRKPSEQLRDQAARYLRRIEDERRWGNVDLAELRIREYENWSRSLIQQAEAEERKERGRR